MNEQKKREQKQIRAHVTHIVYYTQEYYLVQASQEKWFVCSTLGSSEEHTRFVARRAVRISQLSCISIEKLAAFMVNAKRLQR